MRVIRHEEQKVHIVGIGGSLRPDSTAERALRAALASVVCAGVEVRLFSGDQLIVPPYDPSTRRRSAEASELISALATADGVMLASPAYHGSISGLLKNVLDYVEDLRDDEHPYLSGRGVGCLVVAQGWQSGVFTLGALRDVVHALRGWPTPLGVVVNSSSDGFGPDGRCTDPKTQAQLEAMALQVVEFARMRWLEGIHNEESSRYGETTAPHHRPKPMQL